MFGFGATSQQQPQGATFGQSAGFGSSTPSTGVFGSQAPAFGGGGTGTNLFGGGTPAPQQQPSMGFGSGGFGAPSSSAPAFGASSQANQQASAFGRNMSGTPGMGSVFGTGGSVFGSGTATGSGTSSSFGGFGMNNSSAFSANKPVASGFGFNATPAAPLPNQGTGNPPFAPQIDTSGADQCQYQSISCMPEYKDYSFDELRVQDYLMGKKHAGMGMGPGATSTFGPSNNALTLYKPPTTTPQPFSAFGQQPSNSMFSNNTASATNSAFTTSTSTNTFAPKPFSFGQSDQQQPANSAFNPAPSNAFPTPNMSFGPSPTPGFPVQQNQQQNTNSFNFAQPQPNQNPTHNAFSTANTQQSGLGFPGFTNKPATSSAFNTPAASQSGGMSLFPNSASQTQGGPFNAGSFSLNPSAPGLFGSTTQAAKPFSFNTPALTAQPSGFGNVAAPTNAVSSAFNSMGSSTAQPGSITNSSLFPNSSSQPAFPSLTTATTNTPQPFSFNKPATSTATTSSFSGTGLNLGTGAAGGTSFSFNNPVAQPLGSTFQAQQQPAQALLAQVDHKPWGSTPLFDNVSEAVIKKVDSDPVAKNIGTFKPSAAEDKRSALSSNLVKSSPMAVTRAKIRLSGFHQTTGTHRQSPLPLVQGGISSKNLSSSIGVGSVRGASQFRSSMNSPSMMSAVFTPGASVKRLELRSPQISMGHDAIPSGRVSGLGVDAGDADSASVMAMETPSKPPRSGFNTSASRTPVQQLPKPTSNMALSPYMISPSLSILRNMSEKELAHVRNLTISHSEHGSVTFLEPVDLRGIAIEDLCGGLVVVEYGAVIVYPDAVRKPPHGTGLNVKSRMTLHKMWPRSKVDKTVIKDPNSKLMQAYIKRIRGLAGTTFESYDVESGTWTFVANE